MGSISDLDLGSKGLSARRWPASYPFGARGDKMAAAAIGLVSFVPIDDSYLCRLAFSLREHDETSREGRSNAQPPKSPVRITLRER